MKPKHYKVFIAEPVDIDLQKRFDYISNEQGEPLNAEIWRDGIFEAIYSLEKFPERCAIAPENYYLGNDSGITVRHLIYKKTFRVIFAVVGKEVRVLSVRHSVQVK